MLRLLPACILLLTLSACSGGGTNGDNNSPDPAPKQKSEAPCGENLIEPGPNMVNWRVEENGHFALVQEFFRAAKAGDAAGLSAIMTDYAKREVNGLFESVDAYAAASKEQLAELTTLNFDPAYPLQRPDDKQSLHTVLAVQDKEANAEESETGERGNRYVIYIDTSDKRAYRIHNVLTDGALSAKRCAPAFGKVLSDPVTTFRYYYACAVRGVHADAPMAGVVMTERERLTYFRNVTSAAYRERALALPDSVDERGNRSLINYLNFSKHIHDSYYEQPEPLFADHCNVDIAFVVSEAGVKEEFVTFQTRFTLIRKDGQSRIDRDGEVPEREAPTPIPGPSRS